MATHIGDPFLAELDDLSDDRDQYIVFEPDTQDVVATAIQNLDYDQDLDTVSKLQTTERYTHIMDKLNNAAFHQSRGKFKLSTDENSVDFDREYQLVVESSALSVDIDNEILIVHNFINYNYGSKFPELGSHIHHPLDYARVVKKIGNETDLTLVDLQGLLPSATIMVVSLTASTTVGKPLPQETLNKTIVACDRALDLDLAKKKILDFIESKMEYISPNLSAILGSDVAAKLIGTAGGLSPLSKMPACNVQLLGAKKKILAGFSTPSAQLHVGFFDQTEIFQSTPPPLRNRVCRLLAAKSTLAARVDSIRGDPTGNTGRTMRDEIYRKIDKWQELPPAKRHKPLPVPDSTPRKKRGGRRHRKTKEKYAVTDMRKLINRMQFGIPEESSLGDGLGEGYGMLGQAGSGKLRVAAAKVVNNKFKEKYRFPSVAATSGLTSSFAFTPVQGIELANPHVDANKLGSGTQSTYFSEIGTFSKIRTT